MNTLATAAHPDAFAPEAAPTFADLGPGFHLIPVRDHCRVTSARWRVRVAVTERQTKVIDYRDLGGFRLPIYRTRTLEVYSGTLTFEDYPAARRFAERAKAQGYYDKVSLLPPIRRQRRPLEERGGDRWREANSDPMALQAIVILRGALADLREAA